MKAVTSQLKDTRANASQVTSSKGRWKAGSTEGDQEALIIGPEGSVSTHGVPGSGPRARAEQLSYHGFLGTTWGEGAPGSSFEMKSESRPRFLSRTGSPSRFPCRNKAGNEV